MPTNYNQYQVPQTITMFTVPAGHSGKSSTDGSEHASKWADESRPVYPTEQHG